MATTLEQLNNIRCSPYRFVPTETVVDDGESAVTFYAPRPIMKTDYPDNIPVIYNGSYSLPILTYRAYRSIFGDDAVRLYWIIMEFSGIVSMRDIDIGTVLIFPSVARIKSLVK